MLGASDVRGTAEDIITEAALADEYGYDAFWTEENISYRDGITTAASLATLEMANGLVVGLPSPYLRHPVLLATVLNSIDDFSGGRVDAFVIGTNAPEMLENFDRPVERPVKTMSETYDIIQAIMRDGRCDYHGEIFQVDGWKLRRPFDREIPMYLAAIGPKMRELAAYKFDGIFMPVNTTVQFAEEVVNDVTDHLEQFDRRPDEFIVSVNVASAVTSEESDLSYEEQTDGVLKLVAWHLCSDHHKAIIDEYSDIDYDIEALRSAIRNGDWQTIRGIITDEVFEEVAAIGPAERARQKFRDLQAVGVDYPVVFMFGPSEVKRRTVRELAPDKL